MTRGSPTGGNSPSGSGRRDGLAGPAVRSPKPQPLLEPETHVPVNRYNAQEVKDMMKKCQSLGFIATVKFRLTHG